MTARPEPSLLSELPKWELGMISLTSVIGDFPLTIEEINAVKECVEQSHPLAHERWHHIEMKRVFVNHGISEPYELYYERIKTTVLNHNCMRCGNALSDMDSTAVDLYNVDPYCSQYCAEVANGVPLPYSSGALVFDKYANQNK